MARISAVEMRQRLRDTERHLVRLGTTGAVEEALSKKYGVNERTVRAWIKKVREQWEAEALAEEQELGIPLREVRRQHIRQMLLDIHAQAQSRSRVVKDAKGDPVIVEDPNTGEKRPLTRNDPNTSASLQVIKQLRFLDALDQPRVKHVHLSGALADSTDEYKDRTPAEQAFYLSKGRWPTLAEAAVLAEEAGDGEE